MMAAVHNNNKPGLLLQRLCKRLQTVAWLLICTLAAAVITPAAHAVTWVASPLGVPHSLEDALRQAQDGDTVEVLPGEYKGGEVVLDNRRLTIKGMGKRPLIKGSGKPGAPKALWLVRGGEVSIENIEFRGSRSSEGEGAGIRMEGGKLLLRRCAFYDNEYGVHAINAEQAELTIEDSEFGLAPKVVGGRLHLLNVGRLAKLTVSGSRFQQGFEGQLIKTRARENTISYNWIHDGRRGGASYEIEIANGGLATLIGNIIGQGSESQNPVLIAYATEPRVWDKNVLVLSHNTLINNGFTPAWFVRVIHKNLPPNTEVMAINNLLVGSGLLWPALTGRVEGNRHATPGMVRDAETYAFELPLTSIWRSSGVDPKAVNGRDLSPKGEFEWPVGVTPLPPLQGAPTPGAYQR
jgi:Right handed beta helix region